MVLVGVVGICVYAQMAGRVAAVSGRATFEIIRERLGPRAGLANLAASFLINLLTVTAEIGGIALALQLATSVDPLLWIPVAAFGVWIVIWRARFDLLENVTGLLGLTLIVFAVALFMLAPDWAVLAGQALQPGPPQGEPVATYWFYAVALFGAAMTPYEVFFFSSGRGRGALDRRRTSPPSRLNVLVGFPLGGLLSIAIAACAAVVLLPASIEVTSLSQVVLPVAEAGGKVALAFAIVGILAATFGAALETTLSSGYTLAQYFGWSWGKFRKPAKAARFHLSMIICVLIAVAILATGVDPILVTEYSVVFSAVALPLTYLPILIIANDPEYMGDKVNGRGMNLARLGLPRHHPGRGARGHPTADHHGSRRMNDHRRLHRSRARRAPAPAGPPGARPSTDCPCRPSTTSNSTASSSGAAIDPDAPPPKITAILTGADLATRIFGGRPPSSRRMRIPWRARVRGRHDDPARRDRRLARRDVGRALGQRAHHRPHSRRPT